MPQWWANEKCSGNNDAYQRAYHCLLLHAPFMEQRCNWETTKKDRRVRHCKWQHCTNAWHRAPAVAWMFITHRGPCWTLVSNATLLRGRAFGDVTKSLEHFPHERNLEPYKRARRSKPFCWEGAIYEAQSKP
jgi:hypothetical protein